MHVSKYIRNILMAGSIIASIGVAASEPLSLPIPVGLDENRIALYEQQYAQDFKMRSYLTQGTYAFTAASILAIAYKMGFFDFFAPAHNPSAAIPTIGEGADNETLKHSLQQVIAYLHHQQKQISQMEAYKNSTGSHWLINGIKSIGWAGFTIAGSMLVQMKWRQFFEYALAQPSFEWFFARHSFVSVLDRVKQAITLASDYDETVMEHMQRSIEPSLQSLSTNLEHLVAFSNYYLAQLDQDIVAIQHMDSAPRALFHMSNHFFARLPDALKTSSKQAVLVIDEFKAELTHWIQRAAFFEKEVLANE